jgi:hypothetical protein
LGQKSKVSLVKPVLQQLSYILAIILVDPGGVTLRRDQKTVKVNELTPETGRYDISISWDFKPTTMTYNMIIVAPRHVGITSELRIQHKKIAIEKAEKAY